MLAFAANSEGFKIFNISDKNSPIFIKSFADNEAASVFFREIIFMG